MAVGLDNAQNFEAARQSYADACNLLFQVVQRTSSDEEKRKLEAIRSTYTNRIDELDQIAPPLTSDSRSKALPPRPHNRRRYTEESVFDTIEREEDDLEQQHDHRAASLTARTTGRDNVDIDSAPLDDTHILNPQPIGHHQDAAYGLVRSGSPPRLPDNRNVPLQSSFSLEIAQTYGGSRGFGMIGHPLPTHQQGQHNDYQLHRNLQPRQPHPPLFPPYQRPESPSCVLELVGRQAPPVRTNFLVPATRPSGSRPPLGADGHSGDESHPSASWLDPTDELYVSGGSSVHSRSSAMRIRRKHIRSSSGNTEAEFDAALDAAVEAAYDDGFELADVTDAHYDLGAVESDDEVVASLQEARLTKEQLREVKEPDSLYRHSTLSPIIRQRADPNLAQDHAYQGFYDDNSSDEVEGVSDNLPYDSDAEILAVVHTTDGTPAGAIPGPMGSSSKALLPTNVLAVPINGVSADLDDPLSTPMQSFPRLLARNLSSDTTVQSRRESGPNPHPLQIDTAAKFGTPNQLFFSTDGDGLLPELRPAPSLIRPEGDLSRVPPEEGGLAVSPRSSPHSKSNQSGSPTHSAPRDTTLGGYDESTSSRDVPPSFMKNHSSSSLRSIKGRKASLSNIDDPDLSPNTPSSNPFGSTSTGRLPTMPSLPTPLAAVFGHNGGGDGGVAGGNRATDGHAGSVHLFDDNIHSPNAPGTPNALAPGGPVPLEPCPTEFTFRPFWLMRCLYQTLAHPRGGYISTRLFIPRDVWKVKGVKLKNVEDKIASCDLLTAALLKLARVDNNDADAVLEEMQALETVLDQVQSNLVRRLGNEVGPQGSGLPSSGGAESEFSSNMPRSASVSSKSSSFSWKRLRSKNSAAGLGPAGNGVKAPGHDGVVDILAPASLPMSTNPTRRPPKRDFNQVQFTGPNASYMSSLARLFDAVQAIDQIARQVDDPGLRHADKTQVGLELSTRRVAEFFAFYVCRFVMSDVAILLDKFIKRGSEWVLV